MGELEGAKTLAIAFRGTDEGDREFAFQGGRDPATGAFGWDAYAAAHAPLVVAALQYAGNPANGIERILLTGHSSGGIIAEQLTHAVVAPTPLAAITQTITFGQPGSRGTSGFADMLHVVHSDDFVARLSDLSPLFAFFGVRREGVDAVVSRPEASLPPFQPTDLDTPEEILAAALDPSLKIEHQFAAYGDTALLLAEAERIVPGVEDRLGEPERWLSLPAGTRFVLGSAKGDVLEATGGALEVVLGGRGADRLVGNDQANRLGGGAGADRLEGGAGNDILDGGAGLDLVDGGAGDDRIFVSRGFDAIRGGAGTDTAVLPGDPGDFRIRVLGDTAIVRERGVGQLAILRDVELLEFADGSTVPIAEAAGAPGRVRLDGLIASDPGVG
ncbi:MAG: hypothetical protein KatS3mg117_1102 [Geminicoccaceae bacterium]|nr:MAG: hypothetical protein KatS3mg117_1102 [Geminicoccaceae bacterium]